MYREKRTCPDSREIPTPITPVRMDKEHRHITLAYFEQRSTVDYIGAVQGIPVCFDAKECSADSFPLANIHPHQVEFMKEFEEQSGVAFFLIFYSHVNLFYYLPLKQLLFFWQRMEEGDGKASEERSWKTAFIFPKKVAFLCPILTDLRKRSGNQRCRI